MKATVDKTTGAVTIRLSRVLELLGEFETGTVRDFVDAASKVLASEGDPLFEFYSRKIWPKLRGLVPLLFFRESMGEFFLGVVDSRSRRDEAGLTDDEAEMLRSVFGAGCAPEMALDALFLVIGELDFSPESAAGLRPLAIVDRRKEPIPEECLAGMLRVSVVVAVLESCRGMLKDPSYLDLVIEALSRTPDSFLKLETVVGMLNEAYGDPDAVSVNDILAVRERITEILPLFAEYPPGTEHTAPWNVHYEVTVAERACEDVLGQAKSSLKDFADTVDAAGGPDAWPDLALAYNEAVRALSTGEADDVMTALRGFVAAAEAAGLGDIGDDMLAVYRGAVDVLSCCEPRFRLPQAPEDAPEVLLCPVAADATVRPPVGSRVEALADILQDHPTWPVQIPLGTLGTVTHTDDVGRPRIKWHEFEWPRFPLPLPGQPDRRGYEVRSFPLESEQYGLVRVLDNGFIIPAHMLAGTPDQVADCVREVAECLLEKFRCLVFDSEFDLCPLPFRLSHRVCVSCGLRLDLHGFEFAAAVVAHLDRLISRSEGMRRKITESFSDSFARSGVDSRFLKSVRLWRGFSTADRITVQGDRLCAEWSIPNVRPLPGVPPAQCDQPGPCAIAPREFPGAAEVVAAWAAPLPTPDQLALVESAAGEIAGDIFANMRCCCTDFGVYSESGSIGLSWEFRSSYDLEAFDPDFLSKVVDELGKMLACNRFAVRKMHEVAREQLRLARATVGYPPALKELWDSSCNDPTTSSPDPVIEFLGPWIDPDMIGNRRWSLKLSEENSQVAGLVVESDPAAAVKTLSYVTMRVPAGNSPAGSDLFVRLENIDTGKRVDASLGVGETERTASFAVPFLPGERMSGVVFQSDSASAAANVEVEIGFDEGDGGRSAMSYTLPGPVEGEHFVGQAPLDPSGNPMTLTTLCAELGEASAFDLTLRAQNLDTEEMADLTLPAGTTSVSVPLSIRFSPTDRMSLRVFDSAPLVPSIDVVALGRVGEQVEPTVSRTVSRHAESAEPAAGDVLLSEPVGSDQVVRSVRLSATPPSGRPVWVTAKNLATLEFASAPLGVGLSESETDVELPLSVGQTLEVSVEQADDGLIVQSAAWPAEPVSTAPPPLHDTMRLYDEDSPPLGAESEVTEATVSLESPPRGSSLTVRFENVDTGDHQDITVPSGESSVSGTVGLILPEGNRLRVTLLRAGFGAAGLDMRWSRALPPAAGLSVSVVSEVLPPSALADEQSCGLLKELEAFVRSECTEAREPDDFAAGLGRQFGWPFATRLATEGMTVWALVDGGNLSGVEANTLSLFAAWPHDDLTPEFLASLAAPECPVESEPDEPCELEAMLLEDRAPEVVERVAGSLVESVKSLRFELRNLGGDDGTGLVVCVRTDEDVCFLGSRPDVVEAILARFGELLQGDRRDALRKAVEHANDIREKVRVPSESDVLSGLGRPARRLDNPRLPEAYLLSALLSPDPLVTMEAGESSFTFFGGGRDAMADYLRGL